MQNLILFVLIISSLVACAKKDNEAQQKQVAPQEKKTLITTAQARQELIRVVEESIGQVESKSVPQISAEVSGRVLKIMADTGQSVKQGQLLALLDDKDYRLAREGTQSEIKRLEALVRSQQKQVERYRTMVEEKFITQSVLDEAEGQLDALREQLSSAQTNLSTTTLGLDKTRIIAPLSGQIEQRMVAQGDFVKVGDPLFRLSTREALRIHLPFPETAAPRLSTGLAVELTAATAPEQSLVGKINEIRPMVGEKNRAISVYVDVTGAPKSWQPGASVRGVVVIEERPLAVTVPENSVVKRPAGNVVYVIEQGQVRQQLVKLGERQQGRVEILEGIKAGVTVALDGAGFLTDGAKVEVQEARR